MTRKNSLAVNTAGKVRAMILSGEMAPEQSIRQEELSKQLGVSRTPLLQALNILETEMLVQSVPNCGSVVRRMSLTEIQDIYEFREVAEGLACRLAGKRINKKQIRQLRDLFQPFIENVTDIDVHEYVKADQEFHRLLLEFSGNTILPQAVNAGCLFFLSYQPGLLRPPQQTLPEHIAIIDALEKGKSDKAEQSMKAHLQKTIDVIQNRRLKQKNKN